MPDNDTDTATGDSSVDRLLDASLGALFADAPRSGVASGWYGHVPFAFWVMAAVRPKVLVELGTHNGVSYAAFCEAVLRDGLDTKAYAVDTWAGDDHAGFYQEDVFTSLASFHDGRYASFSRMLRTTFDEACEYFADGSVDLLHIDGLHTYDAVRHDFETWQPKLSRRAVVLFHDVNVRENDFGVWRLWSELRDRYPSFEFAHSHGLGVLITGPELDGKLRDLCGRREPGEIATIRHRFAQSGARCKATSDITILTGENEAAKAQLARSEAERQRLESELREEIAVAVGALAEVRQENAGLRARVLSGEERAALHRRAADVAERRHEEAARRALAAEEALAQALAEAQSTMTSREQALRQQAEEIEALRERAATGEIIANSTVWRATLPLRKAVNYATGGRR